MKKSILICALIIGSVMNSQAQEFNFGAKAGVNFANIGGDAEDNDIKTGLHVGVLAEYKLTSKFALQTEILYSMQGSKSEFSENEDFGGFEVSISEENRLKLDYLNIPILAKYYLTDGLSIYAGPQVGFLISAETEFDISASQGVETFSENETIDVKSLYSTIDFGLTAGVEYELDMGIFFGARYYFGLSNIVDTEAAIEDLDLEYFNDFLVTTSDLSIQNNVIQLSVGYKF